MHNRSSNNNLTITTAGQEYCVFYLGLFIIYLYFTI